MLHAFDVHFHERHPSGRTMPSEVLVVTGTSIPGRSTRAIGWAKMGPGMSQPRVLAWRRITPVGSGFAVEPSCKAKLPKVRADDAVGPCAVGSRAGRGGGYRSARAPTDVEAPLGLPAGRCAVNHTQLCPH